MLLLCLYIYYYKMFIKQHVIEQYARYCVDTCVVCSNKLDFFYSFE